MPEPRRFLEQKVAAPPRLFAVVRDDPFDLIEAEVLAAQGDREEGRESIVAGRNQPMEETELEDSDDSDAMADGETEQTGEVLGDESTYYGTADSSGSRIGGRFGSWKSIVASDRG